MTAVGSEVDALRGRGDFFYISLLNTSHRCAPPQCHENDISKIQRRNIVPLFL